MMSATAQAQEPGCDGMSGFADFDFWVGQWDVFDRASGDHVGSNTIRKEESGCLVVERWRSDQDTTGTSINYFNPVTDEWRQVWISEGRYAIDIVGGIENGAMALRGEIFYYNGTRSDFRGTWTPHEDGSVRQFFEQYNADSDEWETWFDGRYVRKD